MELTGRVGPQAVGDNSSLPFRLDKTAAMVLGRAHGTYFEQGSRASSFIASSAVAGVAPGTVLSTTPPMIIWNPPGSQKLVGINKLSLSYVSGTLGAGSVLIAQAIQTTAPTGGTELVPASTLMGSGLRSTIRAFQGSTLAVTPTLVRPSGIILNAMLASTASQPQSPIEDDLGSEFVLTPGNVFVLQGLAGGGSTPLVVLSVTFEEAPLT